MSAADTSPEPLPDPAGRPETVPATPLHGFQGNRGEVPSASGPRSLTIAISREAGSRGGTIARQVGRKIGWQVYHQELLDHIAQEASFRERVVSQLSPAADRWAEEHLQKLLTEKKLSPQPPILDQVRLILALGVQGETVLLGRGAGCLLPESTTLHVRIMAPLAERIAYMSQWLRLTREEAAEVVRLRDSRRSDFLRTQYQRHPSDVHQYDLILNSSLLGEDLCVDLIVQAARAKLAARWPAADSDPPWKVGSPA